MLIIKLPEGITAEQAAKEMHADGILFIPEKALYVHHGPTVDLEIDAESTSLFVEELTAAMSAPIEPGDKVWVVRCITPHCAWTDLVPRSMDLNERIRILQAHMIEAHSAAPDGQ